MITFPDNMIVHLKNFQEYERKIYLNRLKI